MPQEAGRPTLQLVTLPPTAQSGPKEALKVCSQQLGHNSKYNQFFPIFPVNCLHSEPSFFFLLLSFIHFLTLSLYPTLQGSS